MNNADPAEALATMTRLGANPKNGVHLRPRASEEAILRMQAAARKELGEAVPDGYVSLLRITDGVQINGAYFKSADHLVLENLDVPRPKIIVLGNAGNVDEYVFDRRDRRFHAIGGGSPDYRYESFDTFEELLLAVMHNEQVV